MAFDKALDAAGIGPYNHIKASSIFPPGCQLLKDFEYTGTPALGMVLPTVWAEAKGFGIETIAAAISVAIPKNPKDHGMMHEEHNAGTAAQAEANVINMAWEGMKMRDIEVDSVVTEKMELTIPYNKFGCVIVAAVLLP